MVYSVSVGAAAVQPADTPDHFLPLRHGTVMADIEFTNLGQSRQRECVERYQQQYPDRIAANNALNQAIKRKQIVRPTICESCGKWDSLIDGHHDDYSKPLDVRWLCRPCHRVADRERRALLNDTVPSIRTRAAPKPKPPKLAKPPREAKPKESPSPVKADQFRLSEFTCQCRKTMWVAGAWSQWRCASCQRLFVRET